jgi:hypothetical protein
VRKRDPVIVARSGAMEIEIEDSVFCILWDRSLEV